MTVFCPPQEQTNAEDLQIVFLAGPIQGADDWQSRAIELLCASQTEDIYIANPRRPTFDKLSEREYEEQVEWEHRYLNLAGSSGVVMFWLAREATHDCSRAYAQTTRFELGEAVANHCAMGDYVVIGIEEGFSGARYVRKTIASKSPDIPIFSSLEETCREALRMLGLET